MKIYLKYIFLFLIAGSIFSSCNQKDEKVYSFWALQNRATGEYLYEDDGECKFSREKQGDKSLWKIAAAEGDHVCIVNKKSGRYLSLDNGQVVCSVVDQPVTESAEWYYGNFDFGTQFRIVRPSRICIWWKKMVHFACRITQTEIPIFLPIGLG